jgi:hypothetical protein
MERMIVHRRQEGGDWRAIATRMPDGQGRIEFEDVEVQPGATYEYGLGERVGAATLGWARVTVPQPAPPSLALNRVAWLSSARALSIALSLPSAEPAAIELYDVNGRRLGRESLALPQGSHDLQLSLRHLIRPGVFFAHLKQGRHGVSQRFVVIE